MIPADEPQAALASPRLAGHPRRGRLRAVCNAELPLVVDLDGTLTRCSLFAESVNRSMLASPLATARLLASRYEGRTARLALGAGVEVEHLPYNEELLAWLREEKSRGRKLVLASSAHSVAADKVALHLGLFDDVIAADDGASMDAGARRDELARRYGAGGFEYVGSRRRDLCICDVAARTHVVGAAGALLAHARAHDKLGRTMANGATAFPLALLAAMRPHQWVKNLLVFAALFASQRYGDAHGLAAALAAFAAFGLAASSVYVLNDLADVGNDRHHPRKRSRPFASGQLGIGTGWVAWPLLLGAAFALALVALPPAFSACLAVYAVTTVAYSMRLKQVPMLDVLTLAMLYTLRVVAGAVAVAAPLSFWLLTFAMFVFFSLAMLKRYSELAALRDEGKRDKVRGRSYQVQDLPLVGGLGAAAGYTAVLVLALYIQDAHTGARYAHPQWIWLACPLLLFWMSRNWFLSHRGRMHDDPIVFALKDRASWIVAALFCAVFLLAR
jgi:4-hydroxybenzoate polyprenyltransferase/phosphoserine phosphatase